MPTPFKSRMLSWFLRLLLLVTVLIAIGLAVLQSLSGTDETHRRGLEQAASEVLNADVKIGELKSFNLIPQFVIEVEKVSGVKRIGKAEISIKHARVAFSFMDLLLKRGVIEDLQLNGLLATPGFLFPQSVEVTHLGIDDTKEGAAPRISVDAKIGLVPLVGRVDLTRLDRADRPAYRFEENNAADLTFGAFSLKGRFLPSDEGGASMKDTTLSLNGKEIAAGNIHLGGKEKKLLLQIDGKSGASEFSLTRDFQEDSDMWSFRKLSLADITGPNPAWAAALSAWENQIPPQSSPEDLGRRKIEVKIDTLDGGLLGKNLEGSFVRKPGKFRGVWRGSLGEEKVSCGILGLTAEGNMWKSEYLFRESGGKTYPGQLTIDLEKGVTVYKDGPLGANMTFDIPADDVWKNLIPSGHPCAKYLAEKTAP
jgi:hypothetical protein